MAFLTGVFFLFGFFKVKISPCQPFGDQGHGNVLKQLSRKDLVGITSFYSFQSDYAPVLLCWMKASTEHLAALSSSCPHLREGCAWVDFGCPSEITYP